MRSESCPGTPVPIFGSRSRVFVTISDVRTSSFAAVVPHCLQRRPIRRDMQYSSSGRKIRRLPNNRTNEMIRGCEIRSISGRRTPPRPLHDDALEHRLVVHGFRR